MAGKNAAENAIEKGRVPSLDFVFVFSSGQLDQDNSFNGVKSIVGPEALIIGDSSIRVITNEPLSYKGYPGFRLLAQSTHAMSCRLFFRFVDDHSTWEWNFDPLFVKGLLEAKPQLPHDCPLLEGFNIT